MSDQPDPIERPASTARIWRRFRLPPGALPRYAHHAGLVAIVLLMGGIMFLTTSLQLPTSPASSPELPVAETGQQASIRAFERGLREQLAQIDRDRAELEIAKQALMKQGLPQPDDPWAAPPPPTADARPSAAEERASREARGLFADNVAFRRASASQGRAADIAHEGTSAPTPEASRPTGPPSGQHRLLEGQIVQTVLANRLDGSFAGPVQCLVTVPVYARDGETLLIPAGARFLGSVKPVADMNQRRLAVAFHRLIFPDGRAVPLDQWPGLNAIGDTALRDQVDHHYWQTFGATAAVGALAGLSVAQTRYGPETSGADAYRQGVSTSMSSAATRILDRYLNQMPTVTIREGHAVLVYFTADLDLPPYAPLPPHASVRLPED